MMNKDELLHDKLRAWDAELTRYNEWIKEASIAGKHDEAHSLQLRQAFVLGKLAGAEVTKRILNGD